MTLQLLKQVIVLARQAGVEIMRIYAQEDFGATSKADNSPLTLADLASHRAIVAGLQKFTSPVPILSEEAANISYTERKDWRTFWLVDPLDGTKEFIKRNGEFTVNIALIENGIPILGVVYAPALDVCYYGAAGLGAFKIAGTGSGLNQPTRPAPIHAQQHYAGERMKVVASRSHGDERTATLLSRLADHECISMGSSLKLCLVAEGKAHFYPRLGPTMEWDTAAAHAVVNAAGGKVCDVHGIELHYNKEDLHNPEFFVMHAEDTRLTGLVSTAC